MSGSVAKADPSPIRQDVRKTARLQNIFTTAPVRVNFDQLQRYTNKRLLPAPVVRKFAVGHWIDELHDSESSQQHLDVRRVSTADDPMANVAAQVAELDAHQMQ
ncbi:hypothetical protein MesoLj113a_45050 [Mesorhizobium sp. 113-1-2]|nr:hypothetical protein MesoLj113a_45050 [Mesorhizobium sp. 113-1-2]